MNEARIQIEKRRLTDGSPVYAVAVFDADGGCVRFDCRDEKSAREIASQVRDALNESCAPVGEWQMAGV